MKKIFIDSVFKIVLIAVLIVSLLFLIRINKKVEAPTNYDYTDIVIKLDSILTLNKSIRVEFYSKLDELEISEVTIIHNHENFKTGILDGSISDDSVAMYIASKIRSRRDTLLLLYSE